VSRSDLSPEPAADRVEGEPEAADSVELEALGEPSGAQLIHEIVRRELGDEAATNFARAWQAHDVLERRRRPEEGLRERKKRLTRQRISDIATTLFVARGFDAVKVSEIADQVGVSEKTIYNYFPTKESLVYDQADEQLANLVAALRNRGPGVSPTSAIVAELKRESADFAASIGDEARLEFLPRFGEMIRATPALRAAWGEYRNRLVDSITEILAAEANLDPREPEPITAARAVVSLVEMLYDVILRHIATGLSAVQVQEAVNADLDRAARLLDTGLWSLHLVVEGRRTKQQLLDAALAAENARQQVVAALRQARQAWRELRGDQRDAVRQQRVAAREQRMTARNERAAVRDAAREGRVPAREGRTAARDQHAAPQDEQVAARRGRSGAS
jgi:AcrR family transcriptional regulator